MTKRRVWRYTCGYCKKSNCSAASIKRHEAGCHRNPARHCDLCESQWPRPKLVAIVADADLKTAYEEWDERRDGDGPPPVRPEALAVVAALDWEADGCPMCMIAAIAQSGTQAHLPWDFKKALDEYKREKLICESEIAGHRSNYYQSIEGLNL